MLAGLQAVHGEALVKEAGRADHNALDPFVGHQGVVVQHARDTEAASDLAGLQIVQVGYGGKLHVAALGEDRQVH